jgi:hypothetical protein
VKANFLNAQELPAFAALNPAVRLWLETVANVRRHRETQRRPVDLWAEERPHLQPVNPRRYDVARVLAVRADRQFRVTFETNRYCVPARFAGAQLTLKAYPEHLCLYHDQDLIARHVRCWERHRDIADPDHAKALVAQRRHAQDAHALARFLALCPQAPKYHEGLALAARQCAVACAQDPRPGRDPRHRGGQPGDGRCPRLRGATATSTSPT